MRYFIDTEFIESGPSKPIQLISIGIVAEDGRELYEISNEYDSQNANEWVRAKVLSLIPEGSVCHPLRVIADRILAFVQDKPEFWGYYADYDWVVFCQIFGTMTDLPKGWPMYCNDIKQLCKSLGNPRLPVQISKEHNALEDARWNKIAFDALSTP